MNFRRITIDACAGVVGGSAAGAVGSVSALSIESMAAPAIGEAIAAALSGVVVWGILGALGGLVLGLVGGHRSRRAAVCLPALAAWWAGMVGAVESAQMGAIRGTIAFTIGYAAITAIGCTVHAIAGTLWRLRWLLLAWLILALAGEVYSRMRPATWTRVSDTPEETIAQLRCASVPGGLGLFCVHYWFAIFDPETRRWHRWEVWQTADTGGTSWGHVHEDLMDPDANTGGGPMQIKAEWRGAEARALLDAVAHSAEYPYRGRYFAWPGPNSNTYVAWILRRAGVAADLEPKGIGKDYLGLAGVAASTTRTGIQAESSLLGMKIGLRDGAEVHFLYFTFGLDALRPAVKTPFGRLGMPE